MPDEIQPIHRLSYLPRRQWKMWRVDQWVARRAHWLIALALIMPLWAMNLFNFADSVSGYLPYWIVQRAENYLFCAVLFLPASVKKLNWRHTLLLAAIAAGVFAIDLSKWRERLPYPYGLISWFVPIVGLSHWFLNRPRKSSVLAWTLALTVVVALTIPAVLSPIRYIYGTISLRISSHSTTETDFYAILYLPFLAVLTWLAIPAAEKLAATPSRFARTSAAFGAVACVTWFFIFFNFTVFQLATRSLQSSGPFDRTFAVSILEIRLNAQDNKVLWQTIETADWRQPVTTGLYLDFRDHCIQILAAHNLPDTAARLSSLLRRHPSPALAEFSASILAKEHRYESAPELLRYAVLDMHSDDAKKALESMRIPQGAYAILRHEAYYRAFIYGLRETPDSNIEPYNEKELAKLLGRDVGPKWGQWVKFIDDQMKQFPTPLSPGQASEVDRVAVAIYSYWITLDRLQRAGRTGSVPSPNFDVPGTAALEQEIQKYRAAADEILPHD